MRAASAGHSAEAIRDFIRALDFDSTFALARSASPPPRRGAPAATRLYEDVPVGIGGTGIPGQWTESDDAQFDRAIRLA
jgi:hypothetical protein